MLRTPSFSRPGRPAPERALGRMGARPRATMAGAVTCRSTAHIRVARHIHVGRGASAALSFLTVPRRYIYILPRSPLPRRD